MAHLSMEALPVEIVDYILRLVPPEWRADAAETCVSWRSVLLRYRVKIVNPLQMWDLAMRGDLWSLKSMPSKFKPGLKYLGKPAFHSGSMKLFDSIAYAVTFNEKWVMNASKESLAIAVKYKAVFRIREHLIIARTWELGMSASFAYRGAKDVLKSACKICRRMSLETAEMLAWYGIPVHLSKLSDEDATTYAEKYPQNLRDTKVDTPLKAMLAFEHLSDRSIAMVADEAVTERLLLKNSPTSIMRLAISVDNPTMVKYLVEHYPQSLPRPNAIGEKVYDYLSTTISFQPKIVTGKLATKLSLQIHPDLVNYKTVTYMIKNEEIFWDFVKRNPDRKLNILLDWPDRNSPLLHKFLKTCDVETRIKASRFKRRLAAAVFESLRDEPNIKDLVQLEQFMRLIEGKMHGVRCKTRLAFVGLAEVPDLLPRNHVRANNSRRRFARD